MVVMVEERLSVLDLVGRVAGQQEQLLVLQ